MQANPTVYRHFAADGTLLYVGSSLYVVDRQRQHTVTSRWFDRVATITLERFPTKEAMLIAERDAITAEKPIFNLTSTRRGRRWLHEFQANPNNLEATEAFIATANQ